MSYHKSSLRVTITRRRDLPQLFGTTYHNSSRRVIVSRLAVFVHSHIFFAPNLLLGCLGVPWFGNLIPIYCYLNSIYVYLPRFLVPLRG